MFVPEYVFAVHGYCCKDFEIVVVGIEEALDGEHCELHFRIWRKDSS